MRYSEAWLETKPYKEVYDRRAHPKMSPQLDHSLIQGRLLTLVGNWAVARGFSGPELRVYLAEGVSLVPDVSFMSFGRLNSMSSAERQKPRIAPEFVCEVRSPDDRGPNIRRKTELYLAHGAIAVLNADPARRTVLVATQEGECLLRPGDRFEHPALPGLALSVSEIFAPLDAARG
ncbi:MAG: Uma2 family endonuclease [Candidatus Eremiobacteraeota bacterium]|nr:Uma2 family endonuclease [Candidatus Eremiobacteraeota bacterium]